ncbi:hypothetical protein [Alkalibacterium indicireducens]|uniref:hypothetical protein n=1 Tax=Alkalibacterium indicireducens TaxID=398758 RepID=UPI0031FA33DA
MEKEKLKNKPHLLIIKAENTNLNSCDKKESFTKPVSVIINHPPNSPKRRSVLLRGGS